MNWFSVKVQQTARIESHQVFSSGLDLIVIAKTSETNIEDYLRIWEQ